MKIFILKKHSFLLVLVFFVVLLLGSFLLFYSFSLSIGVSATSEEDLQTSLDSLFKQKEKIAYLTFDDGPTLTATPKVLEILKKENVKASFFVIGKHVAAHPELVKQAYEDGHYIANHSYDHNNSKLYSNDQNFLEQIQKTDREIAKAIGDPDYISHIFRFPNGYMSSLYKSQKKHCVNLLHNLSYAYIDWNCLNNDSVKQYSSYALLTNLKESSKNKNTLVILMHDTTDVSNSSLALESSIKYLKSQGYQFKNFYDL